jgi:hypothetical protein
MDMADLINALASFITIRLFLDTCINEPPRLEGRGIRPHCESRLLKIADC